MTFSTIKEGSGGRREEGKRTIWTRKVHTKDMDNDSVNRRHLEIETKRNLTRVWAKRGL